MTRVLLADDEPGVVSFVSRALTGMGLEVEVAGDGAAAVRKALAGRPFDLLLLDLVMPGMDGLAVLIAVRAVNPSARVIMLSAADDVRNRVSALDAGASDFIGKPFAVEELLARVRSCLREKPTDQGRTQVRVGTCVLDLRRRSLISGGVTVSLSQREFLLLQHLMAHAGDVCSREELLSQVWGYTFDPGTNVVEVYVRRLRSKLPENTIETVRHVGYSFQAA
ncbi:response regulator transcription factor [Acidothermaceae bacterium B102]|nr:response regulator transcription factor [Acidothermaceae bacterium B102]